MLSSERLRALRQAKGLTHEALAEKLNLNPKQIWRYEANQTQPNGEIVARMARLFGVSTDYLLGISDEPIPDLTENSLSKEERFIITSLRQGKKLKAIRAIVKDE